MTNMTESDDRAYCVNLLGRLLMVNGQILSHRCMIPHD